jgi:hypothetical protein
MAAANIMTEAAIITRSGFTEDFADFAIAPLPNGLGGQISIPSWTADKAQKSPPIAQLVTVAERAHLEHAA